MLGPKEFAFEARISVERARAIMETLQHVRVGKPEDGSRGHSPHLNGSRGRSPHLSPHHSPYHSPQRGQIRVARGVFEAWKYGALGRPASSAVTTAMSYREAVRLDAAEIVEQIISRHLPTLLHVERSTLNVQRSMQETPSPRPSPPMGARE